MQQRHKVTTENKVLKVNSSPSSRISLPSTSIITNQRDNMSPLQIIKVTDDIRFQLKSQNHDKKLLIKSSLIPFSTSEQNDDGSDGGNDKDDDFDDRDSQYNINNKWMANMQINNGAEKIFEKSTHNSEKSSLPNNRVTSALSASSAGRRERTACWRTLADKRDPLFHPHTPANHITASELCRLLSTNQDSQSSHNHQMPCKMCSAKLRLSHSKSSSSSTAQNQDFSTPLSLISPHHIEQQIENPFLRVASSGKSNTSTKSEFTKPTINYDSNKSFYFTSIKQLETKIYNGISPGHYITNKNDNNLTTYNNYQDIINKKLMLHSNQVSQQSDKHHNSIMSRYQKINNIKVVMPTQTPIHLSPPILSIFMQKHSINNYFVE